MIVLDLTQLQLYWSPRGMPIGIRCPGCKRDLVWGIYAIGLERAGEFFMFVGFEERKIRCACGKHIEEPQLFDQYEPAEKTLLYLRGFSERTPEETPAFIVAPSLLKGLELYGAPPGALIS